MWPGRGQGSKGVACGGSGILQRARTLEDFPSGDSKYQGAEAPPWLEQALQGCMVGKGEGGQRGNGSLWSCGAVKLAGEGGTPSCGHRAEDTQWVSEQGQEQVWGFGVLEEGHYRTWKQTG